MDRRRGAPFIRKRVPPVGSGEGKTGEKLPITSRTVPGSRVAFRVATPAFAAKQPALARRNSTAVPGSHRRQPAVASQFGARTLKIRRRPCRAAPAPGPRKRPPPEPPPPKPKVPDTGKPHLLRAADARVPRQRAQLAVVLPALRLVPRHLAHPLVRWQHIRIIPGRVVTPTSRQARQTTRCPTGNGHETQGKRKFHQDERLQNGPPLARRNTGRTGSKTRTLWRKSIASSTVKSPKSANGDRRGVKTRRGVAVVRGGLPEESTLPAKLRCPGTPRCHPLPPSRRRARSWG